MSLTRDSTIISAVRIRFLGSAAEEVTVTNELICYLFRSAHVDMDGYISKPSRLSNQDFQSRQVEIIKGRPTAKLKSLLQTMGQKME